MEPTLIETDEQWEAGYPQGLEKFPDETKDEVQAVPQVEPPQATTEPFSIRPDGLALADDLSESLWQDIGKQLKDTEWRQWGVGDWFTYGMVLYGKRKAYKLAEEATGFKRQTLYAYTAVAEHFTLESCRRVQGLSFSHHRVVALAGLDPEMEDYYLKTSKERGEALDDLAQRIRKDKEHKTGPSAAEQSTDASTQPSDAEQPTEPKPIKATIVYSVDEQRAIENLRAYLKSHGQASNQKIGLLSRSLVVIALNNLGFTVDLVDPELSKTVNAIESLYQTDSGMEATSGTTTVSETATQEL